MGKQGNGPKTGGGWIFTTVFLFDMLSEWPQKKRKYLKRNFTAFECLSGKQVTYIKHLLLYNHPEYFTYLGQYFGTKKIWIKLSEKNDNQCKKIFSQRKELKNKNFNMDKKNYFLPHNFVLRNQKPVVKKR